MKKQYNSSDANTNNDINGKAQREVENNLEGCIPIQSVLVGDRPANQSREVIGKSQFVSYEHHTSHVTRHTPHVTRHTPHATRHTPHVTRHIMIADLLRACVMLSTSGCSDSIDASVLSCKGAGAGVWSSSFDEAVVSSRP
jgi:hypothetical protein